MTKTTRKTSTTMSHTPSQNELSTSTTPASGADVASPIAKTELKNVAWVAHRFGKPLPVEADEFQEADEFLNDFAANKQEWPKALATARKVLSESGIAGARLSSVARARLAKGMSQAQLAELIGTS